MVTLRDYQQRAHDAAFAAWGVRPWWDGATDVYRTILQNLSTSAGKTVIAGSIINTIVEQELGRCLFVADTDELCFQPRKSLYENFGITSAVEKAESRASLYIPVVVGSAQTLARESRLERFPRDHFGFVFVDEAHRGSDRNKRITDYFSAAKVCGMTATAFRAKLKDLSTFYEHVAFEMGLFDLIGEGYITPLKVLTLPVKVDISSVKQTGGDYDLDGLDTTIAPMYDAIIDILLTHEQVKNRQILVFHPLIKSSQAFVQLARAKGLNARHIDGKSENREELQVRFARKDFQCLSNSNLLTTGWDCPAVDCLLNLVPTRSAGMFRQKTGRVVRLGDGRIGNLPTAEERKAAIAASAKPDALILDLLWQTERFGLMGPADLIAGNQDERLAIQMKIAGLKTAEDLQALATAVQEDREHKLKKALEEAAKRRSAFTDAINLIGALLHNKKLIDYEPVMGWEAQPPTAKQREWMEKNGIDPTSAKDRGHVSALMNVVFSRRKAGLCSHRVVAALEERGIAGALKYTDAQAYEVLRAEYPFPFGKHARLKHTLRQVPLGYWEWAGTQPWIEHSYPIIWKHMTALGLGVEKAEPTGKQWWREKASMFDKLP